MPSIDDVYNELQQLNTNLTILHADLYKIVQGVQVITTLGQYADQALAHLSQQDDTIICELEHISAQTCSLLNEAHAQSGLQATIRDSSIALVEMYKSSHPASALELQRSGEIDRRLEECCPPEKAAPVCVYEPCKGPPPLAAPPDPEPQIE